VMALPISNSQSQTTTQSPQAGAQSISGGTQSSAVQPGTTANLLNGSGSIALHPTDLQTVNLNATPTQTTATATATKPHHTNPIFFGFAIGLFALAVVLFWLAGRAERSKTYK